MANREMKDSGVEWIGEIPKRWEVMKFKYVMKKDKKIAKKYNNENVISLTKSGVIIRDLENPFGKMPASFDGYQHVEEGDLLLCLFDIDVTPRCVGIVKNNGVTSPAYSRYKLMDGFDINYYNYLLTYLDDEKILLSYTKSLRNTLTDEYFGAVSTIKPSLLEQQKIAAFLDEKVSHIDNIIEDTKKSIENLKAYKQSLITETVTKGLDPNVEMKDSGIDWIGEIPAHWNIMKLSYLSRKIGDGIHSTPNYDDSGNYYFINGNNFYNKSIIYRKNTQRVNDSEFDKFKIDFDRNTIFISLNGTIGNLAYYNEEKIILGKSAGYIKIKKDIDRGFIYYYLLSAASKTAFDLSFAGTTINNLSLYTLRNLKVTIPSKEEQVEVSMFLDKKTKHIDLLINQKEKIINELESYKKSLIYEYVTGKKEVK